MTENFTAPYMPKEEAYSLLDEEAIDRDIHVVNPNSLTIQNYRGIPSSMNLMLAEAASSEELTRFKKKQTEILKQKYGKKSQVEELKQIDPEINNPEAILKCMLESMTPLDGESMAKKSEAERKTEIDEAGYVQLDYEEAVDYYDSKYAKFIRYYQYLERIISLEWFIYKLQFKQTDVIPLDNAIQNGLPFW